MTLHVTIVPTPRVCEEIDRLQFEREVRVGPPPLTASQVCAFLIGAVAELRVQLRDLETRLQEKGA